MICNAFISWEIQDNLKLRSVISEIVQDLPCSTSERSNSQPSSDDQQHQQQQQEQHQQQVQYQEPPKLFVNLRPFLHPELTDCSRDACELRLHCSTERNVSISCVRVLATASRLQVFDHRAALLAEIAGAQLPGDKAWFSFQCNVQQPAFEIKLKFLSLHTSGSLQLGQVQVTLEQYNWPATLNSAQQRPSLPSLLERLSEIELSPHARDALHRLSVSRDSAEREEGQEEEEGVAVALRVESPGKENGQAGAAAAIAAAGCGACAALHHQHMQQLQSWLQQRLQEMEERLTAVIVAKVDNGDGGDGAALH